MKTFYPNLLKFPAAVKLAWVFAILFSLIASQGWGQTTLFNDNFNSNNSATWSTSGAVGSYPNWSLTRSGNDWGARVTSNLLELSNDASATANANGWVFGYRDINALSGWNTTLSSNTGTITWEFNMRQIRTDPAGFGSGSYGVAFVLAGTSATSATAGSGYAVVLGQSGSTDPIRLASYNNGLQGTLTNIITSNTTGLTDFGTNYLSVRVTYVPGTNTWQLFLRNDGTTAFTDPTSGTALTSQGTAVNNTYTSTAGMRYIGGYWQGSTAATQTAFFDNVYLKKTSSSFTVTFNGNGSTGGSMANQTASAATNLTANAFTRTGYTFAGWNTAANGGGTSYANGASFPFTANTTLFAQWTANTLTITYNSQGGSAISNGSTTTGGQIAASPGTPTRAGYTFNGWFTASSGGTAISFPYTHNQTASFTLFAQWTANTITITYDSQGGSAISNGSTTTGGSIAASPGTPTRAGYTFNGWFTASSGGTAISFPYTHNQTANFTLFAQWTANTLTVTFDSQGGSAISNGTTTTGGTVANPGNPTRAGFTFDGWFVAASGGTAITFPYSHGQTANFTLFAQWTVAGSPTLNGATLSSALSNVYGTASTGVSFAASGTFLTGNITVTAQTGYEVSTSSGSGYGATVSVASGTTVWVRFDALQNAGTYNNATAAVLSSAGATPVNVLTSGSGNTVSPKPLSVTAPSIASKAYDGTTTAGAVTVGTLSGFVGSQTVTATGAAANYSSANAGTYAGVVITYTLSNGTNGGLAANYSLANGSASGVITPKALTITAPSIASKVYDATTTAGAVTVGTLSGLVGSETLTVTGAAANYSSANVGTYAGVVITYTLINGSGLAANYSLANGTATGVITPKALSITAPTIASKIYDATTTAGAVTVGSLSGFVGSQTVTVTGVAANYSSANAGTYTGVVITYTLSNGTNGGLAANYSLANGSATGVITPKPLTITAPTIASKAYDATTTAGAVTVGSLSGFVGSQTVTATATAVNYSSANVGTYTNVTVNYTLTNGTNGGLAINYSLAAGSATGVITQRALTITANNVTKEIYQVITGGAGSTAFTSSGLQGGQAIGSVSIAYGAAAGSTGQGATPGTYTGQVTPSVATGGSFSAANYAITYVAGSIIVTSPNAMVLTTFGSAVCENFNGLTTSGTSSTMPTGWAFSETGSSANTTYTAGTGSSNTGDTYSFGTSSDRTLGGLRSGSLNPTYGARIFNNTSATISTLTIAYTGKTWRVGDANRLDRIDFQYSTNATSLTTGTWTDENNLDYANPGQATGNGSVVHSANISHTLTGLNIPVGSAIWIRWTDFDATGADDGMGVDDVCITAISPCTSPNSIAFVNQPTNVQQDVAMAPVTVRAFCTSTGNTATGFTGTITLTVSGGGCGYVSQTVAAVNGVATFNNIIFTRSTQTGITLTASASGFSDVTSSSFNVTAPPGALTTVAAQDFGSNTTLSYTTSVGGLGVFNTSNTRGVSNSNCLAYYYNDCLTGASGSSSTATFTQSSGLSGLNNVKLSFAMAWGGPQLAGANCDATSFSGTGLDSDDFVRLETSINGGSYVTTFQVNGFSNKQYPFSTNGVTLNHNANQTLNNSTEPSAFTINLPAGVTSVAFRFTFKVNRRNELVFLDNFSLTGAGTGAPLALPIANAGISFSGCNGGANQLQGSATNTVGAIAYSWSPSSSLDNATISNPVASNTATTTYSLTVTDADNCSANSSVTVSVLNGTAGLWTGAENTDWFNCQNWASGSVPSSSTNVVIPDVTNDPEIAIGTASCANFTINSSAFLNMTDVASLLNVSGNFTNNGSLGAGTGTIAFVANSGTQTITTGGTGTGKGFNNVTKSGSGTATLAGDMQVNNNFLLSGGTFDVSTSNFALNLGGNWTNIATFNPRSGTVTLNGAFVQDISISGTGQFYNLAVNKATGNVNLLTAAQARNQLSMTQGNITTNAHMLTLGESVSNPGTLNYTSGRVIGTMRRWFAASTNSGDESGLFPLGNSSFDQFVKVEYTTAPSAGGTLTAAFKNEDMADFGVPTTNYLIPAEGTCSSSFLVTRLADEGFWEMDDADGLSGGVYDIRFEAEGFSMISDLCQLTALKRVGAGNWDESGTHKAPSGTTTRPILMRQGASGWSNWGFGGGNANPLPIELLNFSATALPDHVLLNWATASETNNAWFEVERSLNLADWNLVCRQPGAGNSNFVLNYADKDLQPLQGISYYRLKQTDFDGSESLSNPVAVNYNTLGSNWQVSAFIPQGELTQIFLDRPVQNLSLEVFDASGRRIESHEFNGKQTTLQLNLNYLSTGVFWIRLRTHEKFEVLKFVR